MAIPVNSCLLVLLLIPGSISFSNYTTTPVPYNKTATTDLSVTARPSPNTGNQRLIYDDCVTAHYKTCNRDSIDGFYSIKSRTSVGYEDTLCQRGSDTLPDCTGIGWTYIGSVTGNQSTSETGYYSEHWTAKEESQTVFNSQFWSANVTEVCISSTGFKIQFPVLAPSLRSLFFENTTIEIPLQQWLDGIKIDISNLDFTNACFVSGFNVGSPNLVQARFGIVSVIDEPGCSSDLKAVGIGLKVAGKDYGSVHGLWANLTNTINDVSNHQVYVYVRSRLDPTVPKPTASLTAETTSPIKPFTSTFT